MFPASMAAQRDRLVGALLQIVGNVHQVEAVVPYLRQLGVDHRKYDVLDEHYPEVGASLLATLEHFLGEAWTPDLAADWAEAYGLVAQVMTEAAHESTQPPWYEAEVVDHEQRVPGLAVLTLRPDRPVPYTPGQSVSVQTPLVPRLWRSYSPANAPRHDGTIELHVRAIDGGWVSGPLVYLTAKGDVLRLGAPIGEGLSMSQRAQSDILMLAGGTGLAPLRAIVEELARHRQRRQVYLYVGGRTAAELYDLPMLRLLQQELSWLHVLPVVSRDPGSLMYPGEPAEVAVSHRSWADAEVFVCGSPTMVETSLRALAMSGVDPARVRREAWSYDRHTAGTAGQARTTTQGVQA